MTSHKFEGSELVQSLLTLQDGRFALSKVCVGKRGLHVQNRPEGCILQCSSTQKFPKISTVSLDKELVQIPLPMFCFEASFQNIHKISKSSNLSFKTSSDKSHKFYQRFINFGQQYKGNIYVKALSVIFLLKHLRFVINLKKMYVRSCRRSGILRVDC